MSCCGCFQKPYKIVSDDRNRSDEKNKIEESPVQSNKIEEIERDSKSIPEKVMNVVDKVCEVKDTIETVISNVEEFNGLIVESGGPDVVSTGVSALISTASSLVPWLIEATDIVVPGIPIFGGIAAKLIKKTYQQACTLYEVDIRMKELMDPIFLVALETQNLGSVLKDLYNIGDKLGVENDVREKTKDLELANQEMIGLLETINQELEIYRNRKNKGSTAVKFVFAESDLEKFSGFKDQLNRNKTKICNHKADLSLFLISKFFSVSSSSGLSVDVVFDILFREHASILNREDNKEVVNNLKLYVPLMCAGKKPPVDIKDQFELDKLMDSLIHTSDANLRVTLLQGVAGTGKSLFGWRMMQKWDQIENQVTKKKCRMPIYINLALFKSEILDAIKDGSKQDFLLDQLMKAFKLNVNFRTKLEEGADITSIQQIRNGHFVFILDGVDELGKEVFLKMKPEQETPCPVGRLYSLDDWPNSAFVVSSRTDFFQSDDEMLLYCGPRHSDRITLLKQANDVSFVKKIHLMSFNESQRNVYIKNFAVNNLDLYPGWNEARFKTALDKQSQLKQMLTEPLMLYLALNILPSLEVNSHNDDALNTILRLNPNNFDVEPNVENPFPSIRRAEVYALFTYSWLVREAKRNNRIDKSSGLVDKDFTNEVVRFCRDMAFHMFLNNSTQIKLASNEDFEVLKTTKDKLSTAYRRANERVKGSDEYIRKLILEKEEGDVIFRCSPLKKSDTTYSFLHKTVQEFFTATFLLRDLAENQSDEELSNNLRGGSFDYSQLALSKKLIKSESVLNTLRFCADLVDRQVQTYVQSNTECCFGVIKEDFQLAGKALWDLIQGSRFVKVDESNQLTIATATSNALTILVASGIQFTGCDFSNAQLGPTQGKHNGIFGDYSGGRFSYSNLTQSNWNNSRVDGCDFTGANLDRAEWNEVEMGQRPMMLGHIKPVTQVCMTKDGKYLISGSWDYTIRVWLLSSGEQLHKINVGSPVYCICLSVDEKFIICGSSNNLIKVFSFETHEIIHEFNCHMGGVSSVCVSPDGKHIISGSYENNILFWSFETGKIERELESGFQNIVRVCNDGKYIFSGADNNIQVWDFETGEQVRQFVGHKGSVQCICMNDDGKFVISGSSDCSVRVWSMESGEQIHELIGHSDEVTSVCLNKNGKLIISGSSDCSVRVWSLESGELLLKLDGHIETVTSVCMSADGKFIISSDSSIRVWLLENGEQIRMLDGHEDIVTSACVSKDNKYMVSGSKDCFIRVWSLETGEQIHQLLGHKKNVTSVCLSNCGKYIISGSGDCSVRVWILETGKLVYQLNEHENTVNTVCVSKDGEYIISGSNDSSICIFSFETGELIRKVDGESDFINSICLGSDMIFACCNSSIQVWSISTGEPLFELKEEIKSMLACIFLSHDESRLLVGNYDSSIQVWSLETRKQLYKLVGHNDIIYSICISSDDKYIISGSYDCEVRVWSLESGEFLFRLAKMEHEVNKVCLSNDGRLIVSALRDKVVQLNVFGKNYPSFTFGGPNSLKFKNANFDSVITSEMNKKIIKQLNKVR